MIVLFIALPVFAILLIFPGWLWFRRKHQQSIWLLVLPIFGIGLWVALIAAGVGAQSLSNLSESFVVAATAIAAAYFKLLVLDQSAALSSRGNVIAFFVVALVAVGLRLFMPALPE